MDGVALDARRGGMSARQSADAGAHRRSREAAVAVALLVVVVTLFLPWAYSGEVARSSFELASSARKLALGFPWDAPIAVVWFVLPALAGLAIVLLALGVRRWAAGLAAAVGAVVAALAAAALLSSLDTSVGPLVALPAGLLVFCTSMWCLREPKEV